MVICLFVKHNVPAPFCLAHKVKSASDSTNADSPLLVKLHYEFDEKSREGKNKNDHGKK